MQTPPNCIAVRAGRNHAASLNLSNEVAASPAPSVTKADHGSGQAPERVPAHASVSTASSAPTAVTSRYRRRRHKPPLLSRLSRRAAGVPAPEKNGDYAFLLHLIASLKSTGKGAIILPHGVLFRGNREADIRRNLISRGFIKGIIGLPANLFYGTGIPACIVIIDKEHAASRKGIFMIDASKGFLKDGNKNRLREQDIHKIVDVLALLQT